MPFYTKIAILFIFGSFLQACFSVPDYPHTPEIEFDRIQSIVRVDERVGGLKDSVIISIKFKDGDGDLGYTQAEIDSLRKMGGNYNYVVSQVRKVNGKYIPYDPKEPLSGYFHRLSADKPGAIEGKIQYNGIQVFHSFYKYPKDIVKFDIYIRDRAGNVSNTIRTDSVILRPIAP